MVYSDLLLEVIAVFDAGLFQAACTWFFSKCAQYNPSSLSMGTISLAARGGNLAKIPPNQVIDDFGRGSSVESESE